MTKPNNILPVILCGGSGMRLWPLSRKSLPKQFVPLIGGKSLLQATFERVSGLAGTHPIWTVASGDHRFLVRDAAEAAKISFTSILEPMGRNPWLALLAAGLLGGLYALVFLGLKHKLTRLGGTLVSANKERFMAAGEAFGGIKDIKLLSIPV